jgi:hypothetical protein
VSGDIKRGEIEALKNIFFCIKLQSGGVSKRRRKLFKHFTNGRFFAATCYSLFWPARLVRGQQEFRDNTIAMRNYAA